MATVKDIILDEEGDLDIKDGDFLVRDSDQQHIVLIVNTFPGNWKQYPTCGVGIIKYLASAGQGQELRRNISVQLKADGYQVNQVLLQENTDGHFDYSVDAQR